MFKPAKFLLGVLAFKGKQLDLTILSVQATVFVGNERSVYKEAQDL